MKKMLPAASLLSIALAGCALTNPPPLADPAPTEARLLAANRAAPQKTGAVTAQQQPTAAHAALDVDRINKKLAAPAETRAPPTCSEREATTYADAHATWGDTMQDLQRRKACASRHPAAQ